MKKLALALWFLAACGGGDSSPPADGAGLDGPVELVCNPITQTGCESNEKCTWIIDQVTPAEVGHIGCAPVDGSEVAVGGPCAEGPPGPQGFDNCVKGAVCVANECKTICDPQLAGVATGCAAQESCSRYANLFDMGGTVVAGVCDPQCDPLNQNLLTGTGITAACGSTNPAMPNKGCFSFDFETFSCAPVAMANLAKTDRVEPALSPAGNPFINGCAPGYVPFFIEMTGSMKVLCTGTCAAGPISSQTTPTNETLNAQGLPNGSAKLVTSAAPAAGDGRCQVGKKGSAGPQNCVFLWGFLTDAMGNPGPSQYNETVGVCFSFPQFQYDSNNDMEPDKAWPNCATLPKRSAATPGIDDDSADFGCQLIADSMFAPASQIPSAAMMRDFRIGFDQAIVHRSNRKTAE